MPRVKGYDEEAPETVEILLDGTPAQLSGRHDVFLSDRTVVFQDGKATVPVSLVKELTSFLRKESD